MALDWLWWRAWVGFGAVDAAAVCVAGVALGDMDFHFAWQAWHLWHWAGSGGALGRRWSPATLRHFAWQAWHLALGDIHLRCAWQAWHLVTSTGVALMALGWLWWRLGAPGRR